MPQKTDVPQSLRKCCPDWRVRYAIWGEKWGETGYAASAHLAAAGGSESSFEATPEVLEQVESATPEGSITATATDVAQHAEEEIEERLPAAARAASLATEGQFDQQPSRPPFRSPLLPPSVLEQRAPAHITEPPALYHTAPGPDLNQYAYGSHTGSLPAVGTLVPDDANHHLIAHTTPPIAQAATSSYLEYSYDVTGYPYSTDGYTHWATFDGTAGIAGSSHETTMDVYGPNANAQSENQVSVDESGAMALNQYSAPSSHQGQTAELPTLQTSFNNLALELDWTQWFGAGNDGVLSEEQWLAIFDAAEQGDQAELNAGPAKRHASNNAESPDGYDAAHSQAFAQVPITTPVDQWQNSIAGAEPPTGLLWEDNPSVELVEWLSLPNDLDLDMSPSPGQASAEDSSRPSGNNPWGGSSAFNPSQGVSFHDSWTNQENW